MIKVRIESVTFGDCSRKVTLPDNIVQAFQETNYMNDDIIIDYVLSVCKTFRKYGRHLNEKFILYFE